MLPTPGMSAVPHAKKKPVLAYELFLKYGGEGGIDSLRSPLRGSPLTACAVCPTGCASCRTPVGGSHPPRWVPHAKKKPVLAYELFLKYGGEGGIDSLRSPLRGSPLTACAVCPTGCASCRTPVGGSHPPRRVPHAKKKPVLAYELFLKYGGEGGIDSLRSPLRGSPLAGSRSVQLALPVVEPRSGVLIPPGGCHMRKKKPVLAYELFLKYGGEGGIRTPDTLPYTHFPGVLLQPLGHLTILSCCSPWVGNGALL